MHSAKQSKCSVAKHPAGCLPCLALQVSGGCCARTRAVHVKGFGWRRGGGVPCVVNQLAAQVRQLMLAAVVAVVMVVAVTEVAHQK